MPGTSKIGKIAIGADVLAALGGVNASPPSGWMNSREIAKALGVHPTVAMRKLRALRDAGLVSCGVYIVGNAKMHYYDVSALKKQNG